MNPGPDLQQFGGPSGINTGSYFGYEQRVEIFGLRGRWSGMYSIKYAS